MNPCDALPEDWSMYYNGCWMRHEKLGIGRVEVAGDLLLFYPPGAPDYVIAKPKELSTWWPRAGAFNYNGNAVYIARRNIRNMRKSAIGGDHYYVKWGKCPNSLVMQVLRDHDAYPSVHDAWALLRDGRKAVAVTRDIIFSDYDDGECDVYFRGMEVGRMSQLCGFVPTFSASPWTRRVLHQLEGS